MSARRLVVATATALCLTCPVMAQTTNGPQDPHKMPKAEVMKIQQALQHQGYDVGKADGEWGPQSETALKEYQANRALPTSNGQIDANTLASLDLTKPAGAQ